MSIETISKEVQRIRKKYATKDPYALCHAMKISLLFKPMGTDREACKGFYLLQSRKQAIMINSDLSEELQRIILMHEIGHAVLHRKAAGARAFHDFAFFDEVSIYEYEANIFAADYLLDDDEVLDLLNEDLSFFGAASRLNVPAELLDFKFRVLKRKGYKIIDSPLMAHSDFLKKV
ncbi:MAG: ImmA/IrrE family metallo-endopeptidase [Eubacteriales bacterium]|nr:ImmA/IrrE family metallo-endopeptidase [Eubacteriales bacterium]